MASLSRYRDRETIGVGAYGFVYKAFDSEDNTDVAIKRVVVGEQEAGESDGVHMRGHWVSLRPITIREGMSDWEQACGSVNVVWPSVVIITDPLQKSLESNPN
eukprot:gene17799-5590_t